MNRDVLHVVCPLLENTNTGGPILSRVEDPVFLIKGSNLGLLSAFSMVPEKKACGKCGKVFANASNLLRHHKKIHQVPTSMKCAFPGCENSYNKPADLAHHLLTHTNDWGEAVEEDVEGQFSPGPESERTPSPERPTSPTSSQGHSSSSSSSSGSSSSSSSSSSEESEGEDRSPRSHKARNTSATKRVMAAEAAAEITETEKAEEPMEVSVEKEKEPDVDVRREKETDADMQQDDVVVVVSPVQESPANVETPVAVSKKTKPNPERPAKEKESRKDQIQRQREERQKREWRQRRERRQKEREDKLKAEKRAEEWRRERKTREEREQKDRKRKEQDRKARDERERRARKDREAKAKQEREQKDRKRKEQERKARDEKERRARKDRREPEREVADKEAEVRQKPESVKSPIMDAGVQAKIEAMRAAAAQLRERRQHSAEQENSFVASGVHQGPVMAGASMVTLGVPVKLVARNMRNKIFFREGYMEEIIEELYEEKK